MTDCFINSFHNLEKKLIFEDFIFKYDILRKFKLDYNKIYATIEKINLNSKESWADL